MENITPYSWTVKTLHQGPSNGGVFAHLVHQWFHSKGNVSEHINKTARKEFPLRSFRVLLRRKNKFGTLLKLLAHDNTLLKIAEYPK